MKTDATLSDTGDLTFNQRVGSTALSQVTCGATTRAGSACKLIVLYASGRCKLHGGLSTGPTSEAGREQSRINGRKGGKPRRNPSP